jgi:hypothetical protein
LVACAGEAGDNNDGPDGGDYDAGVEPDYDAAPPLETYDMDGYIYDYGIFAAQGNNEKVYKDGTVESVDINPPVDGTIAQGDYQLKYVPAASLYSVKVKIDGYRNTISPSYYINGPLSQNVWAVPDAYVASSYNNILAAENKTYGTAFVHLTKDDGSPLVGVPLDNVIMYYDGVEYKGAFTYGAGGYPDTARTESAVDDTGYARMMFYNLPPGTYELRVNYNQYVYNVKVPIQGGYITLAQSAANAVGEVIPEPLVGPFGFYEDIYPRLQNTAQGGEGCANCHYEGNQNGRVPFDQDAQVLYDYLVNNNLVVIDADPNVAKYSVLIQNPLFGSDNVAHPNKLWSDVEGQAYYESYKVTLDWLTLYNGVYYRADYQQ